MRPGADISIGFVVKLYDFQICKRDTMKPGPEVRATRPAADISIGFAVKLCDFQMCKGDTMKPGPEAGQPTSQIPSGKDS